MKPEHVTICMWAIIACNGLMLGWSGLTLMKYLRLARAAHRLSSMIASGCAPSESADHQHRDWPMAITIHAEHHLADAFARQLAEALTEQEAALKACGLKVIKS